MSPVSDKLVLMNTKPAQIAQMTYEARYEPDYSWEGEETGYRGHSHIVKVTDENGKEGRCYVNIDTDHEKIYAEDVLMWCEEAEAELS